MSLLPLLNERFAQALAAAGAPAAQALVQTAGRPEYGDYQVNGVMGAAKALKLNPRELAQKVITLVQLDDVVETMEIAGAGFINIRIKDGWLAKQAETALADTHLGVSQLPPERVMVEYSSPNLAKEMHVGHLRSTIIGDCLARVQRFVGREVILQNHVGDWGTQFGMLTAYLTEIRGSSDAELELSDLESFYRKAKVRFDEDDAFADRARNFVVKLQGGDPEVNALWRQFVDISMSHCEAVYRKLGVLLTRADVRGESFYNDDLPVIVQELRAMGILTESEGAQVVFLPGFSNKEGEPAAYIIQKQGGGYLYATTDLGAIRYRVGTLKIKRGLVVVDARQALHFQQLFAVAKLARYLPDEVQMEHIPFGTMMGDDGKPFKSRTGDLVKLVDMLDEAQERAYALVSEKNPDMDEAKRRQIVASVGIGAVKYADLSKNRTSDYIFNWDTMLSFEGNAAPYLQYAYTRVKSIFRKAEAWDQSANIQVLNPQEHALALELARFNDVVHSVERDSLPHYLCTYAYGLATAFSRFFESSPVIENGEVNASRLKLCDLTARVLSTALGLLGIEVLETM